MSNHLYDTLNKGLLIGCVAMELRKAFNVLNYEILMEGTEIIPLLGVCCHMVYLIPGK